MVCAIKLAMMLTGKIKGMKKANFMEVIHRVYYENSDTAWASSFKQQPQVPANANSKVSSHEETCCTPTQNCRRVDRSRPDMSKGAGVKVPA
jgi:hypothetical protein